jgi:hypothetical protein
LRKSRWAELVAVSMAVMVGFYALGFVSFGGVRFDDLESSEEAGEVESLLGPGEPDDEYFLLSRAGGPGKVLDEAAVQRGRQQAKNLRAAAAAENAALPASAPRQLTGPWSLVGPTNVGGRIVDLVVDIDNPDTIYVAAASGGVWKSTDAAVTMEYAWDDSFPQGMGAITMGSDGRL